MAAPFANEALAGWAFIQSIAAIGRLDGLTADPHKKLGRHCYARDALEKLAHETFKHKYRAICARANKYEWLHYQFDEDTFGNTFATYFGRDRLLPAVMMQSHLDSVPNGGIHDGVAGVASALLFQERLVAGPQPRESFRIAVYSSEESSPHHGYACLGSAYATGLITLEEFKKLKRSDGTLLWDTFSPEEQDRIVHELKHPFITKDNTRFSFETHIEQGPHIAAAGKRLGIVDKAISGATREHTRIKVSRTQLLGTSEGFVRCRIRLFGESNHTGTTPPNTHYLAREKRQYRHDALVAASYAGLYLLRDKRVRLIRSETTRDTGYSTVPHRHVIDVIIPVSLRSGLENRIRKLRGLIDKKFGVRMTTLWHAHKATSITFFEREAARRALKVPVLVNMLATRAYLREKQRNDLGDTRVTVADFHLVDGELWFKLDHREADRAEGARLRDEVHASLRRRHQGALVLVQTQQKHSQLIDADLEAELCAVADELGITYKKMPSLAGHDTDRHIAAGIPSAMLFYRQHEGVSHNAAEDCTEEDFDVGNLVAVKFMARKMGVTLH
jgi:acetylornithine deacetylase/succinyl-diaminopimelate desuccinylase-like protein